MPRFSTIIPVHNRERLIGDTLESALNQDFVDQEIICVDDGSTDGTLAALKRYESRGVRVLTQVNQGPGAARNLGLQHARGEYISFLDSDDLWFPWTLSTYHKLIEQHRPAVIAGRPVLFSDPAALGTQAFKTVESAAFSDYLASGSEWRWWGVSSFVIEAECLRQAGGFASQWINGEDGDLMLRLGTAPGFVQVLGPATFGYRQHAASAMSNLERTYAGACHLVSQEQIGRYPGGAARRKERLRIVTRHVRPVTLDLLKQGQCSRAWALYQRTFPWNVRMGRWKYLLGFPWRTVTALVAPDRSVTALGAAP